MAHFAQLNEQNVVLQVIVVNNNELIDETGNESETKGVTFCEQLLGGTWKQTSYSGKIRKNFASIGFTYDSTRDAFIPPKPFDSWILNETTCLWDSPTPYPNDGQNYFWDEPTTSWKVID